MTPGTVLEALATEIDLGGWRFIDQVDPAAIADQFLALVDDRGATSGQSARPTSK
jgi:hypothetical protein